MGCGCFGVRGLWGRCMFGMGGCSRQPSKGRLKETVAAPVVPCGCCVVGLAPAHTAAVWLSVWAAGITGRPFTPAQTAVCSPSPSTLVHSELSAPSFLFLSFTSSPPVAYMPECYLQSTILCIPNLSVCVSVSPSLSSFFFLSPASSFFFAFQLAQKHKRKQQQLGAVIVLLWNSIAFSAKDEVVNSKLHI